MGSAWRLPSVDLSVRLDAGFHAPEYLEIEHRLRASGLRVVPLSAVLNRVFKGAFYLLASEYTSSGVPFIRISQFTSGFLDLSDTVFISCATHANQRKTAVAPGHLLFAKGGMYRHCAVVPDSVEDANISQDVIGAEPANGLDSHYAMTFLQSKHGRPQLVRWEQGNAQPHLSNEGVKEILIALPQDADAQRYIGDKVRQAERLRARAQRIEANVAMVHAKYIPLPVGVNFTKRTRRLATRSLTERLDAHFYPSAVEQYFRQIGGTTRSLGRLSTLVINGQSQPEAEEGVAQATVANLGRSFVEGPLRAVKRPMNGTRALALHDLLLCNAAHNKSYIGRDVTYSQLEGAYPSTEVMVIRVDRAQVPASFIRQYLKTDIGYRQIQSTIRGITAHSYPSDVKLIEIPIPPVADTEREIWFATDDKMLVAGRCADAAKLLTAVAVALVEHLIDGRLSEADLIAAQKGLEAGNRDADRAILQSLRQGDAADAPPLILDLDGLYALLDEPDEGSGP
ncbi:hypothetical protein ACW7BC_22050 [Azospirillum argentinense]